MAIRLQDAMIKFIFQEMESIVDSKILDNDTAQALLEFCFSTAYYFTQEASSVDNSFKEKTMLLWQKITHNGDITLEMYNAEFVKQNKHTLFGKVVSEMFPLHTCYAFNIKDAKTGEFRRRLVCSDDHPTCPGPLGETVTELVKKASSYSLHRAIAILS